MLTKNATLSVLIGVLVAAHGGCSSDSSSAGSPGAGQAGDRSGVGGSSNGSGGASSVRTSGGPGGTSNAAGGGSSAGGGGSYGAGGAGSGAGGKSSGVAGTTGNGGSSGSDTTTGTGSAAAGQGGKAGGSTGTGGQTGAGGSGNAGGSSAAGAGGRSAGVCPGGTYPAPDLTGTPQKVYSATANNDSYEGTVWLASRGVLLFSDISNSGSPPPAATFELTPPSTVRTFLADSGTNGLAVDVDGTVLACSHKVQGIVRMDPSSGSLTTVVSTDASGKHFNSPNDIAVRSDGNVYFSDPNYQIGSRKSETGIEGVYRVSPSGAVTLVDGTLNQPNGVALSPDETVLYVGDASNRISQYSVAADGSTGARADFVASVDFPDGMGVDCAGNLYVAVHMKGTMAVFDPTGKSLGTVQVASNITNMGFGGADHKTLYISAGTAIYALSMNVPGFPY